MMKIKLFLMLIVGVLLSILNVAPNKVFGYSGVVAWGNDSQGQISGAPSGSDFIDIAGGSVFGMALRVDGTIEVWGGKIGPWGEDISSIFDNVPSGNFKCISAGLYHAVALDASGYVKTWGNNSQGALNCHW
ncbi:hypothetical protein C4565_09715 [Candidatus Parcubacteria bacterium]|jgi:alpha-tubulin suppressor-like RCC1 family protein|nr:MAG: hypothetical protein C4565_09715 [Candidatus Parcubacteria bacterium]